MSQTRSPKSAQSILMRFALTATVCINTAFVAFAAYDITSGSLADNGYAVGEFCLTASSQTACAAGLCSNRPTPQLVAECKKKAHDYTVAQEPGIGTIF